jgi:shikimate kinase
MKNTFCLCGFKHVGKTTIGKKLASKLKIPFVDLDLEIKKLYGKTVSELYLAYGEAIFRQLEYLALETLDLSLKQILSLGGGTITYPRSKDKVLEKTHLVCLTIPYNRLEKRILSKAPLWSALDKNNPKESLKILYDKRELIFDSLQIPKFSIKDSLSIQNLEDYARQYFW